MSTSPFVENLTRLEATVTPSPARKSYNTKTTRQKEKSFPENKRRLRHGEAIFP